MVTNRQRRVRPPNSPGQLVVSSWRRRKIIPWQQVAMIAVVTGFRGGGEMTLFTDRNKQLFKIASSIEDYDDLVSSVKDNTRRADVHLRERDRYGKWSESLNK
jgi:hypothetical protein